MKLFKNIINKVKNKNSNNINNSPNAISQFNNNGIELINGNKNLTIYNQSTNYSNYKLGKLPKGDINYINRKDEETIINKLQIIPIICIAGISGSGKTSMVISIANKIKSDYDSIFYIDGSQIKNTSNVGDIYIDSIERIDLETILTTNKTLLIIDNATNNLNSVINNLQKMHLTNSKVIITTQISKYIGNQEYLYNLGNMDKDICEKILLRNLDYNLSNEYINEIIPKVSYNPLMLKILNALLIENNKEINDLCNDLLTADDIDDDRSIKDRIMQPFLKNCNEEIKIIAWLNRTYVDKGLLNHILGITGFSKLKYRLIFDEFNAINENTMKIHDLIFEAIKNSVKLENKKINCFMSKMIEYFSFLSNSNTEKTNFYNALYMHKDKIKEINKNNSKWGIEIYLLLRCSYDYEFDYNKWKKVSYDYLKNIHYDKNFYFHYISIIEFFERRIYKEKNEIDKDNFELFINQCIEDLNNFLENKSLDEKIKLDILHHLGKMYIYKKEYDKAIDTFEYIIDKKDNNYPSKLQLIRLYQKKKLIDKSKQYIKDILDAYESGKDVDITIVLSTFEELIKKNFTNELNKYVLNELDKFASLILESSNFYFDLPFKVFVKVGKKFNYNNPEIYKNISNSIPMKLNEDITDNDVLFCMGEFYKDKMKNYIWTENLNIIEKNKCKELSRKCYEKITKLNDFQKASIAGFYIYDNMPNKTLELIDKIERKNNAFIFYYESQAFELKYLDNKNINYIDNSLTSINNCIELATKAKSATYLDTFYRQKARILFLKKESNYIEFYKNAIKNANSQKFKKLIITEFDQINQLDNLEFSKESYFTQIQKIVYKNYGF